MKTSALTIICGFIIFLCGQPYAAQNKVAFVQEFLGKVCSEQPFTAADEYKFFGERGGYLGAYLYERISSEKATENKSHLSPIGLLLQMNKKKICPPSAAVIQMAEIDTMLVKKYGGSDFHKLHGLSYVLCIFFVRKDIMSLDNEISVCIFALYCREGIQWIDLPHSIADGVRLPAVLGFVNSDNKYDMRLPLSAWEMLRTKF